MESPKTIFLSSYFIFFCNFEINKMDSAHAGSLGGTVELHVSKDDAEKANELLAGLR